MVQKIKNFLFSFLFIVIAATIWLAVLIIIMAIVCVVPVSGSEIKIKAEQKTFLSKSYEDKVIYIVKEYAKNIIGIKVDTLLLCCEPSLFYKTIYDNNIVYNWSMYYISFPRRSVEYNSKGKADTLVNENLRVWNEVHVCSYITFDYIYFLFDFSEMRMSPVQSYTIRMDLKEFLGKI